MTRPRRAVWLGLIPFKSQTSILLPQPLSANLKVLLAIYQGPLMRLQLPNTRVLRAVSDVIQQGIDVRLIALSLAVDLVQCSISRDPFEPST